MARLIKLQDVIQKTTLSRSRIYAQMGEGKFPKPIKTGDRSVAWREADVDQWIDSLVAQSDQPAA